MPEGKTTMIQYEISMSIHPPLKKRKSHTKLSINPRFKICNQIYENLNNCEGNTFTKARRKLTQGEKPYQKKKF